MTRTAFKRVGEFEKTLDESRRVKYKHSDGTTVSLFADPEHRGQGWETIARGDFGLDQHQQITEASSREHSLYHATKWMEVYSERTPAQRQEAGGFGFLDLPF